MDKSALHLRSILQALFVTFLWSTSWVLIKIGLRNDLPALTFGGLRYTLAFISLAPLVALSPTQRAILCSLKRSDWQRLAVLGVFYYALTQGAIFLSLAYLPAALLNLLLNLTTLVIAIAGVFYLSEHPGILQWFGVALTVGGVGLYFLPITIPRAQVIGLIVAAVCVVTNAISALIGRDINRGGQLPPLIVTFVSMGVGALLLLSTGLLVQGLGRITWQDWLIIVWLAIVNTAFAFTLWNQTLRTLTAVESSIINSMMMPQIAILAYFFLGESLSVKEIIGLILVGMGVLVVQLRRSENK